MFKQNKPRGFELKGRYYDENKERRDNLLRKDEDVAKLDDREKYRERLRESWQRNRSLNNNFGVGRRFLIILAVLVALLYVVLYVL